MNAGSGDHWRGQGPSEGQAGRPYGAFGSNAPAQPSHGLPPPPPPPTSTYTHQHSQLGNHQQSGQPSHNLSIADLTQTTSTQSQYNTQPPPAHTQSHVMAPMSASLPHQSPDYLNRERERDMREMRVREELRAEREPRQLDRFSREHQQAPLQSHAGSLPLHQPVASKVQGSLQGPNGLLNSAASNVAPPTNSAPMPQSYAQSQIPSQSAPQPYLSQPGPAVVQQQIANGQQPILNDALSYLDQVKMRFSDQPDVYNRFLDIMKDFKSQAIDTPGVINRVSELFNGHPALIQGFNTFLPPGYRIECGTDENPDAIRVTTPSGTMTQSLQARARVPLDTLPPVSQAALSRQDTIETNRAWGPQISPAAQSARLPSYDQPGRDRYDLDPMQQDQRNVSQLQNAASVANGQSRLQDASPGPGHQGPFSQQVGLFGNAADAKRGGPVEFNHAISYVNKIKNRFAQQPEIYKQFLEILQTYQRESKPIQDVYSQVTQLFISAPDLLEDFKQFLPESAAHAKAQAAARAQQLDIEMSAVRNEPGYAAPLPQTQTPRPTAKMPPMGQFDPPSTSKDNKKRKAPGPGMSQTQSQTQNAHDVRIRGPDLPPANKRQKPDGKIKMNDVTTTPNIDPNLIPALPGPLPPAPSASTSQEELGFFERAKKQIANRASYTEFLKLVNLYSQDIIDKYVLADRVQSFIGSNSDLMAYFRGILGVEEHDEVVEARVRPDAGRVNLAHCRAFGPSYRHLPTRDQNKTCKGRDGMCFEVLNDVWASHPTWASEDSGFVAHRKNQYEEALHRIEEERHDYDFHIESCQRTIQLLEPVVAQINTMNEHDRATFRVERNFGGASEAIPKRIILKIYGRDVGNSVLTDLYSRPAQVMPVVLNRLKQKLEEWKQVQREWEKVWREQINKQFWKSLDHQGIAQKNNDKKNFQQKNLTSDIQAKYEEQKKSKDQGLRHPKHQLEYRFLDDEVLLNTTAMLIVGLESEKGDISSTIQPKARNWLTDFVIRFFGLNREEFNEKLESAVDQIMTSPVDADEENDSDAQLSNSKRGKTMNVRTGESLRHRALLNRNGKEDSAAPTSKDSTPVPEAMSQTSTEQDQPAVDPMVEPKKWIRFQQTESPAKELNMDEPYPHENYNFYANANLYCLFRLFEMLYSRLVTIKENEAAVQEAVRRYKGEGMKVKPALELNMIDRAPPYFFETINGTRTYYEQVTEMCCKVLLGRAEREKLEDLLRRYYNKTGWQLYAVDKLVNALLRFLVTIMGPDAKEKSLEIANLFFKDRERTETTRKIELQYRKQVEKMSKDGEVFRITWSPSEKLSTIRLFPPDDTTFDSNELTDEARWQYYVASFTMSEPTEGVDPAKLRKVYLRRSIQPQSTDPQVSYAENIGSLDYVDDQNAFIDLETYKLLLGGVFCFERRGVKTGKQYARGQRAESEPFREKFVRNVAWMKDQRTEDVEARKAAWDKGVREGLMDFEAKMVDQ